MEPPNIPEPLILNWIKYEYFKRNTDSQTHKSICELIKSLDEPIKNQITEGFRLGPVGIEEPAVKKSRIEIPVCQGHSEDEEDDWEDVESIPDDADEEWIELHRIPDLSRSPTPPLAHEEGYKFNGSWKPFEMRKFQMFKDEEEPRDDEMISYERMKMEYERLTKEEIDWYTENRQPLGMEDLVKVLSIRQTKVQLRLSILRSLHLPTIKKVKVFIDYWNITVQFYEDPEHISIQYLYDENGSWIIYPNGIVKFNKFRRYSDMASEDVILILANLHMKFESVEFEIHPFVEGREEKYPNVNFYDHLEIMLLEWHSTNWKQKIKARRLFFRNLRGHQFNFYQLNGILDYFQEGYLKLLTIRTWDDSDVVDTMEQFMNVDPKQRGIPGGKGMIQWRLATHLDIQEDLETNWECQMGFRRIWTDRVEAYELKDMIEAFKNHPPEPKCVITVEEPLEMEKWKYEMGRCEGIIMHHDRCYDFHQINPNKHFSMKFKSRRIEITVTDIDPNDLDESPERRPQRISAEEKMLRNEGGGLRIWR